MGVSVLMSRPPVDRRWPENPNRPTHGYEELTANNWEPRLIRCARCYADAEGDKGHPMYGVLVDDLGSVPVITVVRELARTRLLVRLRLCNACHAEAQSYALDMSEPTTHRVPRA